MGDYSFIDMHIHTEYSDEEMCDITIEQLLDQAQKKAEKLGKDCVIAISDHNSILGVKKAREILASNDGKIKYPNVKLINGIEFTTDLVEMTSYFEGQRVFTRCHTLAYGYNDKDKELTAYSLITHKHFTKNDNIGMQICSARRLVCEMYNINIPFSVYEPLVYMNKKTKFKDEFLRITKDYAKENKISININEINSTIYPYISNEVTYVREASAMGRLKASEIGKIIKDAGGELVIAHPTLLRVTVDGLKYLANKNRLKFSDLYVPTSEKYKNNTDLGYIKNKEFVFNQFLDAYESVASIKISGIEKYYSSNFSSKVDEVVEKICEQRGMYETCGSDYHGEHLHTEKKLGNVLHNDMQREYCKKNDLLSSDPYPIYVSSLSAVDYHLSNKKTKLPNKTILKTEQRIVPFREFDELKYLMITSKKKLKVTESTYKETSKIDFETRIEELKTVLEKFDNILDFKESPRKQAKLILRLNLYAENIMLGIRDVKFKANKYNYVRTLETYKEIAVLMKEINDKFNKLVIENPKIIKDLAYDMRYYYKRGYTTIDKLANLHFDAPINKEVEMKFEK